MSATSLQLGLGLFLFSPQTMFYITTASVKLGKKASLTLLPKIVVSI
jgi:hypothetical protein